MTNQPLLTPSCLDGDPSRVSSGPASQFRGIAEELNCKGALDSRVIDGYILLFSENG